VLTEFPVSLLGVNVGNPIILALHLVPELLLVVVVPEAAGLVAAVGANLFPAFVGTFHVIVVTLNVLAHGLFERLALFFITIPARLIIVLVIVVTIVARLIIVIVLVIVVTIVAIIIVLVIVVTIVARLIVGERTHEVPIHRHVVIPFFDVLKLTHVLSKAITGLAHFNGSVVMRNVATIVTVGKVGVHTIHAWI